MKSRDFFGRLRMALLLCGLWLCAIQAQAVLTVGHLRTEAMENPVGIDTESPLFSWILEDTAERGVMQTAYSLTLYSDEACTSEVWTSGRVESDRSVDVPYGGGSLSPATRYWWKVTVWDNHGHEAASMEPAFFETGLMNSGWGGARWIKATVKPRAEEGTDVVTAYSVETEFEIENLAAGVIFGAQDTDNYFMWQINLEAGYPRFRPHVWTNGAASCLAEKDLRSLVDVQAGKTYRLRIVVDGDEAKTYIDDVLVDTRTNPRGGSYGYGQIGIRQDRALYNYNDLERAYFSDFIVKNLTGGKEETLISESFSDEAGNPFNAGTVSDGRLYVVATYAWYAPQVQDVYDLDLDMMVMRDCAGILFSAYDTNNTHMWSFNLQGAAPLLRRHLRVNGKWTSSDVNLSAHFSKADLLGSRHHVRIAVRPGRILTYLDNILVDTYTDTSGRLHNGLIGFRAYHDGSMNEMVYYDNIMVTVYETTDASDAGTVTLREDFEDAGHPFSEGTIATVDGDHLLCVTSTYEETCAMQESERGVPVFRKVFATESPVKSAKIYAAALGVYDLFLNGKRVGQLMSDGSMRYDELKPGWTDYRSEVNYSVYDVTAMVREGANVVGAQLSNGWWSGAIMRGVYGNNPELGLLVKLHIEYADGHAEDVVTGTDWDCAYCGPVMYGDIYGGEVYDARRDYAWAAPGYKASGWYETAECTLFRGELTSLACPTVQVREELRRTPQKITVYEGVQQTGTAYGSVNVVRTVDGAAPLLLKAGETAIFDMGQNMVGWVRFTARGENGTKLRFRFGEMLNDTGDPGRADDGPGGSLYTYNLRTANATLYYTMNGQAEGETFNPSTSFFGFRYCEVTATHDVEITALTGEVVGTANEETGSFKTSHPDVNQLYSNVIWGQRGNFLSIPTDCPQRDERLGWTGDTQIFARTAHYNADVRAFYHKWMRDMRHSQRADGAYPDMAPFCNFWGYGNAAWGDAGVIVPWTVYLMTGDKHILEENYEANTRYMNFLAAQAGGGYTYNGAGTSFGDWLAYENMDARYVSVCYYAYVADLMARTAAALSETESDAYALDAARYAALYKAIKAEFQQRYLDANGMPAVATQTGYLLALNFGLLPETAVEGALGNLRRKIADNGYKLSTGFVGTGVLNQTLSRFAQDDLAYDLLLQRENPSWLYSVDQGATTVWERWDSYTKDGGFNKHPWIMNSFNHYAYGVVAEWMFRYVGGIEADEAQPGFKHIILQPAPDFRTSFPVGQQRITSAEATHRSGYGLIRSAWTYKENGRIDYEVTVPANTTATLYLPVKDATDVVTENNTPLEEAEGVTYSGVENGRAVIELQSGSYRFTAEEGEPNALSAVQAEGLRVYPNPFDDMLCVDCDRDLVRLVVVNCGGRTLYSNAGASRINTSSWAPGVYVVNASTADGSYVAKAVKK